MPNPTDSTPGPWEAVVEWGSPYGIPVYGPEGSRRDGRGHVGNAYREEDAKMFAAAPELYEALEKLVAACEYGPGEGPDDASAYDNAVRALAKVRGEEKTDG